MIRRIALLLALFLPLWANAGGPIRYDLTMTAGDDTASYYDHNLLLNNQLLPTTINTGCQDACHVSNGSGPAYSPRARLSFVSGTISARGNSSPFFSSALTLHFYGDTSNISAFPNSTSSVAAVGPGATGSAAGYYLAQGRATFSPVTLARPLNGIRHVAAGYYHSCALSESSQVLCWGENYDGQLGLGNYYDGTAVPSAVVGLPSGVSSISAGDSHNCVLATGAVWCWGYNYYGELGIGTTADSAVPVKVTGLPSNAKVTALAAGGYDTCAIMAGGALYCWGANNYGQLGSNNQGGISATPQLMTGFPDPVRSVSVSYSVICVVTVRGAAYCIGFNGRGQLGNNSTANSSVPVPVSGLSSGVRAISAGDNHSCAIDANANAWCWGDNFNGELGNNTYAQSLVPVAVTGFSEGVREISAAGYDDTCAVTHSGTTYCWGYNGYGEVGNDSGNDAPAPVAVSGLTGTGTSLASGYYHNCIVSGASEGAGSVSCWGRNRHGQLGRGGDIGVAAPVLTLSSSRQASASFDQSAGIFVSVDGSHHAIGIGSGWPTQVTPTLPGGIIDDTAASEFPSSGTYAVDTYDLSSAFGPMTGFDLINGSFPSTWTPSNAPLPLVGGGQLVLNSADPTSQGQGWFTATPLTPASSFQVFGGTSGSPATARISAHGSLTQGSSARLFNPASDDLVLGFGPYTALLPAGSLTTNASTGALQFYGNVNGSTVNVSLTPSNNGYTYDFQVQASNANLTGASGPLPVQFYLGDNAASGTLQPSSH